MGFETIVVPYGRPAVAALADRLRAAKVGDPLAPATVVVATEYAGVSTRRLLASGRFGPITGRAGLAATSFQTTYRLAELLGAAGLAGAGRRPLSTPVLGSAIRRVLDDEPGAFEPVREHPSTERALIAAYRELSDVSGEALARLQRQGGHVAEVVRVYRAARALLASGYSDERDLMRSAERAVEAGSPLAAQLGSVVLFLPERLSRAAARFLAEVARSAPAAVIVGRTGVEAADAPVFTAVGRLPGVPDRPPPSPIVAIPNAGRIVTVSDPDEEVRAVVREAVAAAADGVPFDRMGIFYGTEDPYARSLHEQLGAAGVPFNGAAVRTPADSSIGRAVSGLLQLRQRGFRRGDVIDLLATAPILVEGRWAPSTAWERISRRAGITGGVEQWDERLANHLADLVEDRSAFERSDEDRWRLPRLDREIALTEGLRSFVARLADDLAPGRFGPSWRQMARHVGFLVERYLGRADFRTTWPEPEIDAAGRVDLALERLGGLDRIDESPSPNRFRQALDLELEAGLGRIGRFGEGVLVGRPASALGVVLDRVFVIGMAEGTMPGRGREDTLLPDRVRDLADGELPRRGDRIHDDHRRFLVALAAADRGGGGSADAVLFQPRGDLRRSRERVPSRWLLDTVELQTGERPAADHLAAARPLVDEQASFAAAVARTELAPSYQEFAVAALEARRRVDGSVLDSPLRAADATLSRGLDLLAARAGRRFTRFDGNLAGVDIASPADEGSVVSATGLESWVSCPHAYLMRQLLRVEPVEEPERNWKITAIDRGNLVHRVLERVADERIADAAPPTWERVERILADEMGRYERRGLVGKAILWERQQRRIGRILAAYHAIELARHAAGHRPVAAELRFGLPNAQHRAVELGLGDGRSVRFRGSIDRVDRGPTGLQVIDYKTGRRAPYADIDQSAPLGASVRLQLPVYALAAAELTDADIRSPIDASYWFLDDKPDDWITVRVDDAVLGAVRSAVAEIVDAMASGLFVPLPAEDTWQESFRPACAYCNPDGLGTSVLRRRMQKKYGDARIQRFAGLLPALLGDEADG